MKKLLKYVFSGIMVLSFMAGCSSNESDGSVETSGQTQNSEISGVISMNGSTSMEKFANSLSESFMNKYSNVTATVQFTGSGAGIEAVANGSADIGNSSRSLKPEEIEKGLVENIVAIDGIAVITNPSNPTNNITEEQLIGIYEGTIKNWKEVGGNDEQIVVIGREAGSGTRGAFEELLKMENKCFYAQEIDSTGAVVAKVASTDGAIGYVSLDVIGDTVKALNLDGIEPTAENIKNGKYFLCRPFVMVTKGEISKQSDAVKALFEYIDSEEGQKIIEKTGLISAK